MELVDRERSTGDAPEGEPETASPPARVRVAQALAFVALLAAAIGALGPAERVRTTYSWPPSTLPAKTPESALVHAAAAQHAPARVDLGHDPMRPPRCAPGAREPFVLATARSPGRVEALSVSRLPAQLEVRLGGRLLDRLGPGRAARRARLRLPAPRLERGWSVAGGPDDVERQRPARRGADGDRVLLRPRPPLGGAPSIEVTTVPHATRTTTLQAVAWTLARRRRDRRAPARLARRPPRAQPRAPSCGPFARPRVPSTRSSSGCSSAGG